MAAFGRADAMVDDAFEGVRDGIMAAEGKGDSDKLNALKNAVTNITTYPNQFSQGARNAASGMKANVDAGIYNPVDFTTMKRELGIDDDIVMGARRRRRGKKSRKPRKPRRITRRRRGGVWNPFAAKKETPKPASFDPFANTNKPVEIDQVNPIIAQAHWKAVQENPDNAEDIDYRVRHLAKLGGTTRRHRSKRHTRRR